MDLSCSGKCHKKRICNKNRHIKAFFYIPTIFTQPSQMERGDMNVQVIVWDMKMWDVWNEIGRSGRSGKSGRGNSCQARKAWSPLVASSILCFIPPSVLTSSVFIFYLKWPLTARIIQKSVSRTLKQSDIVLYAGGDAGVSIFEDGEAFIQICEKGGDVEWGNALRRKLNGLAHTFEALPLFQRHPRLLCWIQYQEECRLVSAQSST